MFGKKVDSVKKLAKKIKVIGGKEPSQYESLLVREYEDGGSSSPSTPNGFFTVYVGDERRRFMVSTGYLSHPLFKILLEKAYDKFGFDQRSGLVVPCSVAAFQEMLSAMECSHGKFNFRYLVEEFI